MQDAFDVFSKREEFLDKVRQGTPSAIAAYEVGWTPRQLDREMQDDEFVELFDMMVGIRDDAIEAVLYQKAVDGNQRAIEMWLYNRNPDRWKDSKTLKVENTGAELPQHVLAAAVDGVRMGVLDAIRNGTLKELQRPVSEMPIIDAEVIEDGGE